MYTEWGSAYIIHKVIKYLSVFMSFISRVHKFWIFQQSSLLIYLGLLWCYTEKPCREGWPLLTVLLKLMQMGTYEVQMVSSLGSSWRYQRFLPCLGWQNIFSSPYTTSIYVSPSPAQQPGQAVVQGRLSLNMCFRCYTHVSKNRIKILALVVPSTTHF